MKDRTQETFRCPLYQQTVSVLVENTLCERCDSQGKRHISDQEFKDCSGFPECGIGQRVDGQPVIPNVMNCPAHCEIIEHKWNRHSRQD